MNPKTKPTVLIILDGFGLGPINPGNAIAQAKTPNLESYYQYFPHTQLAASGVAVGLPSGEAGSTEVGHLNIGAGTVVYQNLPRINKAIENGAFDQNPVLLEAIDRAKKNGSRLHLLGLVGEGEVHSSIKHLYALIKLCQKKSIKVNLHAITDGRDSPPTSGLKIISQLTNYLKQHHAGSISSLMGRFYALDRDHRWDRIERAYQCLTEGTTVVADPILAIKKQYNAGITDEFLEPINLSDQGKVNLIEDRDVVIFFNFRIDRPRELTRAFVLPDFETGTTDESFDPHAIEFIHSHIQKPPTNTTFVRKKILSNLFFVTMTQYEERLPVKVAYPPQEIEMPLGKILAAHKLRQLRITETEKEKFVTYYLNGGQEVQFEGEDHLIIPSKGVKSYDQVPQMSALEITDQMIKQLALKKYDVIICNFANADMVGHTGNLRATIEAVETLDQCLGKIVAAVGNQGGLVLITADHGNAEELINNETGEVDTEHSVYPVPLIIISKKLTGQISTLPRGILADVAPTMLSLMGIDIPSQMTGSVLFRTEDLFD